MLPFSNNSVAYCFNFAIFDLHYLHITPTQSIKMMVKSDFFEQKFGKT